MSIQNHEEVICPNCGKKVDVTYFESINTSYPDAAKLVMTNDLFIRTCPGCREPIRLNYRLLYHDLQRKTVVKIIPSRDNLYDKQIQELKGFLRLGYTVRVVENTDELREKVFALEYGRDDRVIELAKMFALIQLTKQRPETKVSFALYGAFDDGEQLFFFDNKGNPVTSSYYDDYLDSSIRNMFDWVFHTPKEKPLYVNQKWVAETMKLHFN